MITDRKQRLAVLQSIDQHKGNIIKDINLRLRLTDEQGHLYKTILHHWEDDEIAFEAPIQQRDWVIFALPSCFQIYFVTQQCIYMSDIQIKSRHQIDGKLIYKAQIIGCLAKKQQRAHFRLATLCPIDYIIMPNSEDKTSPPSIESYKGTIVNISVGGICMSCDKQLKQNQSLQLQFCFLEHHFNICALVLEDGTPNPNGTFTHRIRFVDIDRRKEDLLSKLIFEKQRLLVQSNKLAR